MEIYYIPAPRLPLGYIYGHHRLPASSAIIDHWCNFYYIVQLSLLPCLSNMDHVF